MGPHGNRILGTALVAIGLLMLLSEMGLTGLGWLWPLILLVIGVAMLYGYYRDRDDSGKVFTATTIVLLAFFFLLTHRDAIETARHWPFFVLAPGIGLLVMSRIDAQRRDAMVPGWIMVGVALVGYFFSLGIFSRLVALLFGLVGLILKVAVPVGLIALGGWLLFSHRRSFERDSSFPEKVEPVPPVSDPDFDEEYEDDADQFGAAADLPPADLGSDLEDAEFEEEDDTYDDDPYDDELDDEHDYGDDDDPDDPDLPDDGPRNR